MKVDYYEIERRSIPEQGDGVEMFFTQAVMICGLCGVAIENIGGPGLSTICKRCGYALKSGKLTGCVVWDGDKD